MKSKVYLLIFVVGITSFFAAVSAATTVAIRPIFDESCEESMVVTTQKTTTTPKPTTTTPKPTTTTIKTTAKSVSVTKPTTTTTTLSDEY